MGNFWQLKLIVFTLTLLASIGVSAYETGPMKDPLVPSIIYYQPGNGLYIEFNEGAMPGCHGNKGGRLVKGTATNDKNFKELYSLILTMSSVKSMKGQILYEYSNYSGWWHCSIVGLVALP